ncbi:hypothetical protein EOA27_04100 [Mesorhizobium sp. M2A.F.Ca.ET.037.01.1.1]|uniref:hypothetical protein n=1 Tax=unclassified Mesorhizobium TaxID=325217 RepID=UPI000F74C837|nr:MULTISPECIES: hypothetical protein [unclassified Mesorhizobium]RUY10064.1 hypothetical protein EOA25_09630 [Mesorhizobium sp. M2A.F.Ca.ET.040.01.1.1]RVC69951.1 hypothetical protein EN759_05965 [Mesorhizobium sp. M00.F.Ca.ET.038.03.1.1]RVC80117.1 hypothetical protein EN766_05905 [Mesorhizobium sp. M2A.F.Ca.ET.046.02.1.1]AZO37190.1 hypothetical protein EJ072_24280 [Mesorhizobium sp. M2A.F.Ca.ET.046.03.2.1]RUX22233.1 hypothetical protein EOA27_04100 [Mesorhizobium sp. M2A.F.Ca.ET.037.01.1.1]
MRERSNIRGGFCTAVLLACAFLFASGAAAQEWTTSLVDVHQGSPLSDKARGLGTGGYELQSGSWISFSRWYHASWIDMHVDFLTQITPDTGFLWGFGTGEQAEKYRIEPSLKLGFLTQTHPNPNSTLSLSVTTTIGGNLTEKPCEADYGEFGTYSVNCRLAAGETAPEETLKYLVSARPETMHLWLNYRLTF